MTTTHTDTALLGVDPQAGFMPGGNLAVDAGDEIVAPLIDVIEKVDVVFLSRDWHPAEHSSFKRLGGIWPDHCVQGTSDADIDERLLNAAAGKDLVIVSKGMDADKEAYSAFDGVNLDTGKTLTQELRERGITKLLVGGLATDYCVKATVLDAQREGFQVMLLTDAVRAVEVNEGDGNRAITEMLAAGAVLDRLPASL